MLIVSMMFLLNTIHAQSKDTAALYREFMLVCNAYKQLPLQVNLSYKKTGNLNDVEADSIAQTAGFYIQNGGAYIHFGNKEQVINDSQLLVILPDIRQMILSKNDKPISSMFNGITGIPIPDSSVAKFSEGYTIAKVKNRNAPVLLQITSKTLLYGYGEPVETIALAFNPENNYPISVITLKRSLIHFDAEDLKITLETYPAYSRYVVNIPGKGSFLVKETKTECQFKKIENKNMAIPVVMEDRIKKDKDNNYVPAGNYIDYELVQN